MKLGAFILGVMVLAAIIPTPYNLIAAGIFGFMLSGIDSKKNKDN